MEKKERKELLELLEKGISELEELDKVVQRIIEKLESQLQRLRFQQTLPTED